MPTGQSFEAGKEEKEAGRATASHLPLTDNDEGLFRPTELRDRVVIMLLFQQVVRIDQVKEVWPHWRMMREAGTPVPLWRILAIHAGVDKGRVFDEAARVYAFEEAQIASTYSAVSFIRRHRDTFTEAQWTRMVDLSVLPVQVTYDTYEDDEWVFATYDPGHPEVARFLNSLDLGQFEVRYASLPQMQGIIAEAFPDRAGEWRMLAPMSSYFSDSSDEATDESISESESKWDLKADPATLLTVLENVLVDVVREDVSKAYLIPDAERKTEIHFAREGRLQHWTTEGRVPTDSLVSFVKERIIKTDTLDPDQKVQTVLQRWIDDQRVGFRISVTPVRDKKRDIDTEIVAIRVLK